MKTDRQLDTALLLAMAAASGALSSSSLRRAMAFHHATRRRTELDLASDEPPAVVWQKLRAWHAERDA